MHAETLLDIAMMHSDTLIVKAQTGDAGAQGKLVQLWYKRIYNFGYKFFLDHDLAMEVSQRTFISMCKNLQRNGTIIRSASSSNWNFLIFYRKRFSS